MGKKSFTAAIALLLSLPTVGALAARGRACESLYTTAANQRTPEQILAALKEAWSSDGDCLGLIATSRVALGDSDDSLSIAARAMDVDRSSALAQLAAAGIAVGVLATRDRIKGRLPARSCGEELGRLVQTLQRGAVHVAAEGVAQLAVDRLEDLGRVCQDDGTIFLAMQQLCAKAARCRSLELYRDDARRRGWRGFEHLPEAGISPYALAADVERSIVWDTPDWHLQPPLTIRYAPWIRAEADRGLQLLMARDPDALRRRGLAAVTLGVGLATANLVLLEHAPATGGQGLVDALMLGRRGAFAEPQILERVALQAMPLWDADLDLQVRKVVEELLSLLAPFETTSEGAWATLLLQGALATDFRNSPERRARMSSTALTIAGRSILRLPFKRWAPLAIRLARRGLADAERCDSCGAVAQELRETLAALGRGEVPTRWNPELDFPDGSAIESSTQAPRPATPSQRRVPGRSRPLP